MKNKALLVAALLVGLVASAACSSPAPANANKTTNTTTTTTTNTTAPGSNTAANTGNANASNTNSTGNSGSTTSQGGAQDFTLVNQTGVEIDKLFVSPHDADEWGSDILGQDTLPSGQTVDIKFSRSEKAEKWDLRIEDSKGNFIEWEDLNLLEISKVTLFYKDGKGTAQVE